MILVTLTAAINSGGSTQTFYLSSDNFVTKPSDTPADTAFDPRLISPGNIGFNVYSDGRTGGATRIELGEIVISNVDGELDDWITYSFDGREVIVQSGESGSYPSDFPTLFTATVESLEATWDRIIIRLRDKQWMFRQPVLTTTYAGNNSLPNGLEGTPDDLKGKVKPRVYGKVFNISPPFVNTSKLTYQVSDGAVNSIDAVYDSGVALTPGTDYATSALLQAASPAASTYDTCIAEGYFRLGTSPAGEITADVTGKTHTNLLTWSEVFSQAPWARTGMNLVSDAVTAPDGQATADNIYENTSGGDHRLYYNYTYSTGTYSFSVFLKYAGKSSISVRSYDGTTTRYADFFLSTGTVTAYGVTASMVYVGNGWYRCSITCSVSAGTGWVDIFFGNYTGDGASGVYVWGAQLQAGPVTAYIPVFSTSVTSVNTTAQILRELSSAAGVPGNIRNYSIGPLGPYDTNTVELLDSSNSSVVGIWLNDESTTFSQAMDEIAASIGAWYGFDKNGILQMGRLENPVSPVTTLYDYSVYDNIERRTAKDSGVPIWKVTVNHSKYYTVQTSGLAVSVTTARRGILVEEYRKASSTDSSIKTQWILAGTLEAGGLLTSSSDASTEASRLLTLFKLRRDIFDVTVNLSVITDYDVEMMDTVTLQLDRFGMGSGKNFRIIGMTHNLDNSSVTLRLWG